MMLTAGRCRVCGGGETAIVWEVRNRHEFYLCPCCEFLGRDPRFFPSPEQERREYDTHHNTLANTGYVQMFLRFLREAVFPYAATGEGQAPLVLDFGSGPGECVLAHVMREQFSFRVDVYDRFFAPHTAFQSKSYDIVTCTEVIEHLSAPLEILAMLKERLNPGGILALMTLFHMVRPGDRESELEFRRWWYRRDKTHISFFRPRTFLWLAGTLGMEVMFMDGLRQVTLRRPLETR